MPQCVLIDVFLCPDDRVPRDAGNLLRLWRRHGEAYIIYICLIIIFIKSMYVRPRLTKQSEIKFPSESACMSNRKKTEFHFFT